MPVSIKQLSYCEHFCLFLLVKRVQYENDSTIVQHLPGPCCQFLGSVPDKAA